MQKHYFNGGVLTNEHITRRHRELSEKMEYVLPEMIPDIEQQWIPNRRAVVMQQMASIGIQSSKNAPIFSHHGGKVKTGFRLGISAAEGTIYFTMDGTDPRSSSAIIYKLPVTIVQHVNIKARTLANGKWSAMTEATFRPEQLGFPVCISEVMYNPLGGSEYEYVELYNFSKIEVDLS